MLSQLRSTTRNSTRLIFSALVVVLLSHELAAAPWFPWLKSDKSDSAPKTATPSRAPANKAATKVQPNLPSQNPSTESQHWWNRLTLKSSNKSHQKNAPTASKATSKPVPAEAETIITYDDPPTEEVITDKSGIRSKVRHSTGVAQTSAIIKEPSVNNNSRRPNAVIPGRSSDESRDRIRQAANEDEDSRPTKGTRVWSPVRQTQGVTLPVEERETSAEIKLTPSEIDDESISLTVRDAPLAIVLSMIAEQHGLNLVAGGDIQGNVTVTMKDVHLNEAFNALLTVNGYSWNRSGNILVISRIEKNNMTSPAIRGLVMRVFKLNYAAGDDIERVVLTLLSPVGRSVVTNTDTKNNRRTREEVVVQDLPEYIERIEDYIRQVDRPPREVLIEAHILQVTLSDNTRHGVNLQEIFKIGNTQVSLATTGFANPKSSPSFLFGLQNNQLNTLLDALKTTTDSKTLASTNLLCLNGQHARMQVGQSLGYLVTTTTTTSTLQNVNFLNVGVVLNVTPIITSEGNVMMVVKPEVSDGQINGQGLPQTNTTEVETVVMLADGQGMVIGGLIKEQDNEVQNKIPFLGDLWLVGRLFQQRTWLRSRNEIIIALVPHIVPYPDEKACENDVSLQRVLTPLLDGPLIRADRRVWEPQLPDAIRNPLHIFHLHDPFAIDNGVPLEADLGINSVLDEDE